MTTNISVGGAYQHISLYEPINPCRQFQYYDDGHNARELHGEGPGRGTCSGLY